MYAPERWREGVVVNLFKKGDYADSGNYRGIMLSSTIRETFCKVLNDDIGTMLKKGKTMSKGQAGFRPNSSCVDHVHIYIYILRTLIDGRKNAGLTTCCCLLDVQKAYDKYGGMGGGNIRGKLRSGCFFLVVQKAYDTG